MRLTLLWTLVAFGIFALDASAHPVSISEADVHIHRDHVRVVLRIMLEDLYLYHELSANDQLRVSREALEQAAAAHQAFLTKAFRIQDVDGAWLNAKCRSMKAPEMPDDGVHVTELMSSAYEYDLYYALPAEPAFLTLVQDFGGVEGLLPAVTHVSLYREGQKMGHTYTLTKGIPSTIRLDWDTPPLPADATDEQIREWLQQEREANLGIATYGAAYSFLYIEDKEVRHEVLVPLLSLGEWMEILRKEEEYIDVAEQDALRDDIAALLTDKSTVTIDGIEVAPVVDRIDFFGLDFRDFAQQAPQRTLSTYTARVGVILRYSCKAPPANVTVAWTMFNDFVPVVFTNVYAGPEVAQFVFQPYGVDFTWSGAVDSAPESINSVDAPPPPPRVGIPVYSMVCGAVLSFVAIALLRRKRRGAAAIALCVMIAAVAGLWPFQPVSANNPFHAPAAVSDAQAADIFARLHQNIYRAFDYDDEEKVYDALERSVGGDLLRDLYLQIHEGLRMQEQGGAIARVESVREMQGDATPYASNPSHAFDYRATWQVDGTVEHWGHIHRRTNEYEATFRIEAIEGAWKIRGLDIANQTRVKFETSLRRTQP